MWYVVQTMAGNEETCLKLCEEHIDNKIYKEMFIPAYIAKMHYKGEWHDVLKTLFPGYFFIDTEDIESVIEMANSAGLRIKFLKNAGIIAPVKETEWMYLNSMMNEEHIILSSVGLIIGDKICITDGPLKNHYGKIKKIDRHRRIAKLEINFFGRPTPAEVGLEIMAKLTLKEFEELKRKKKDLMYEAYDETQPDSDLNIKKYNFEKKIERHSLYDKGKDGAQVEIISGVFEGMTGKLTSRSSDGKEFAVLINLFDTPTNVVFTKEEIRCTQ